MKFKINAGVDIETATPAEVRAELVGWWAELARGPKIRQFTASATPSGATFAIDGPSLSEGELGPKRGFTWKVLYVAFGGPGFVKGTDAASVFFGDASDTRLIASGVTRQHTFAPVYLNGGEALSFTGASTGTGQVFVAGQAIEVPASLIQLIL